MPTINNPFATPSQLPTTADVLANEIKALAGSVAPFLVQSHQQIYHKLWTRSVELGTTPQAVLDSLGTDATKLFLEGSKLVEFILTSGLASMDATEYAPKQTPTFNQDGTVTLQ